MLLSSKKRLKFIFRDQGRRELGGAKGQVPRGSLGFESIKILQSRPSFGFSITKVTT